MVVEGKSPTCYGCGQKGHIRRVCPLNVGYEGINIDDQGEIESIHEDVKQKEEAEKECRD